jgi:hypothetical protein
MFIFVLSHSSKSIAFLAVLNLMNISYQHQSTIIKHQALMVFNHPDQVIKQIHHLRRVQWQGTFVTIVNTLSEKEHLLNLSLFGEEDGRLAYGKVPGHKVAIIHSFLSDILSFQNDPGLSSGAWCDYLAKSSIHNLSTQLQQTSIDIQHVLTTIHSLNIFWDTIMSHEQARYIRELKQKYPLGTTPPPSEIPQIITHLQTRLAHI